MVNFKINLKQTEIGSSNREWRAVRLGDVCEINPSRPKNIIRHYNKPTTFIPMAAVDEKTGSISSPRVVPYSKVARGYTYFEENDVLFAKITPCMQNGKHVIARNLIDGVGFGTTEFHVLRPSNEVLHEWIWYFIRQTDFLEEAKLYFTGSVGQQRVPDSFLSSYIIPLPPLEEQKHIIVKIKEQIQEVERARTACEKQLDTVKALPSAYLREVFESEEVKKWERKRLNEVCDVFSGSSAPQEKKYFIDGKYPFVRVKDLGKYGRTTNLVDIKDRINDIAMKELSLVKAEKGAILFPKSGAAITTNNRAILGVDAFIVSHLAALKVREGVINNYFIYYWLCFIDMVKYMENPGYPSLKLSTISKIHIPLPPLHEQKYIATKLKEKIEQVEKLHITIKKQFNTINALPQVILKKAFTGGL